MIEWSFEQGSVSTFPVRLLVYIRFLVARKEGRWFYFCVSVMIISPSTDALKSL